jgi:hypothetical protein
LTKDAKPYGRGNAPIRIPSTKTAVAATSIRLSKRTIFIFEGY